MTDDARQVAPRFTSHPRPYSEIQARNFAYVPGAEDDRGRRRGRRGRLRRGMLLVVMLGLGWAIYDDPSRVGYWWSAARESAGPVVARLVEHAKTLARQNDPQEPRSRDDFTVASSSPALAVARPIVVASGPAQGNETAQTDSDTANSAPLTVIATVPPVQAIAKPSKSETNAKPRRNLLQIRAEAVGLHYALSPVLLSRLSKADFRNAGYAIRTALAKTADDGTFKWPRGRKAGLAIFEVRFVPGAAPGCRRYVVTIEKDRWLTTALPIEKCDAQTKQEFRPAKS